jgi:L-Ala-D/L-Glu epimerase
MISLEGALEDWQLSAPFAVARRVVDSFRAMTITVADGAFVGRGESSGLYYKGETPEAMARDLMNLQASSNHHPLTRSMLSTCNIGPGIQSAIDCALWELEAKQAGKSVADLLGLMDVQPIQTFYTISKSDPGSMGSRAAQCAAFRRLKVKVGGEGDIALDMARISAVRAAVGDSVGLLVDPNSSWTPAMLRDVWSQLIELGVEILEQPTAPGDEPDADDLGDQILICADEAVDQKSDLEFLHPVYRMINIKLDKSGGLTGGLDLLNAAKSRGLKTMIGCMNGTSLAIAPAFFLAQKSDYADLDSPLDLATDRAFSLLYSGDMISPPTPELWGN